MHLSMLTCQASAQALDSVLRWAHHDGPVLAVPGYTYSSPLSQRGTLSDEQSKMLGRGNKENQIVPQWSSRGRQGNEELTRSRKAMRRGRMLPNEHICICNTTNPS